ncbi:hypothetical protein [Bradyrhizobium ivorense]|uniref:hypothetical protein n=1 Tax=Bradyrhizobium ivorense TaxID=2511166 RepID=UPI001122F29B|nr:hypothetical protein [Bradyrhizobium ivorense]
MAADAIAQIKMGTEALVLCIAGALCERDPSLLRAFRERMETLYQILEHFPTWRNRKGFPSGANRDSP